MKLAVSQVSPLADKALKSHDLLHREDKPLSPRAALAAWVTLSVAGWALILGTAFLIL